MSREPGKALAGDLFVMGEEVYGCVYQLGRSRVIMEMVTRQWVLSRCSN